MSIRDEARQEAERRHFAPYGSTNALCDETVPRGVAWSLARGEYVDKRFTVKRNRTTCPDCRWRMTGILEPVSSEPSDAEVEAAARALYERHRDLADDETWTEVWGETHTKFQKDYRSEARAALQAAKEARRAD